MPMGRRMKSGGGSSRFYSKAQWRLWLGIRNTSALGKAARSQDAWSTGREVPCAAYAEGHST